MDSLTPIEKQLEEFVAELQKKEAIFFIWFELLAKCSNSITVELLVLLII